MAILEVGIDKTFKSITSAINTAEKGDEIKIYPAFYNEAFDCDKDLIFTGVPDDMEDFTTYPQIYNGEKDQYTRITGRCSFNNLIFVELPSDESKELQRIITGEGLSDELIQKYRREENENSHEELFCLAVESESVFENCHFIGARNYGVVVDLKNTKNAPVFTNCGFYLNYYSGVYITGGKKSVSSVVIQNCKTVCNGNGVYGGNLDLKNCKVYHNTSNGVLSVENESKLEHCEFYENGAGVRFMEHAKGIISSCSFASNTDCELFITETSECEVEKSHFITKQLPENHKKNERAVAVMCADKTNARFTACEFHSQKTKDTILAILMGEAVGIFTDCIFQEAENGIVVSNQSKCDVNNCKFADCLNMEIDKK